MKKFVIPLLCTIFVLLLANSTESVAADHVEPGDGIWKDENRVNLVSIKDSKYQVHLQVEVRNTQDQLISITETAHVNHIPHEITDNVFNTMLGKKEIVTIDNTKYEKAQYVGIFDIEQLLTPARKPSHFIGSWTINLCQVFDKHGYTCISPWQANTDYVSLEEDDVVKNHWNILRIIN